MGVLGDSNKNEFLKAVHSMVLGNKSHPVFNKHDQIHREQQTLFLYRAIEEVLQEQTEEDGSLVDEIDRKVEKAKVDKLFVECKECSELVPKRKNKCTNCGIDMTESKAAAAAASSQQNTMPRKAKPKPSMTRFGKEGPGKIDKEERYPHVHSNHSGNPTPVKVADPVLCNPNSYESLTMVLRQIGKDAGITRYGGTLRHWTVVCCDGLPYHLCMNIIDSMRVCTYCSSPFFGSDALTKHHKTTHLFFFFFCLMDAFIYKSRCVNNSTVTKKIKKSTKFRLPRPK